MLDFELKKRPKLYSRKVLWWGGGLLLFFILHFILVFVLVVQFQLVNVFFSMIPQVKLSGTNVLVFGIDDTRYSKRSDSILVFHLDEDNKHIGALSIPRDTRVNIEGYDKTRINHAYAYGGVSLLKQSVSDLLEIPIDYYVKVDLAGVEDLVDIVGGVELVVEKDLNYTDYAGDLYINIKKGKQVLDGKKAVEYLRFRQDSEGDIGRIRRQQYFLSELVRRVISLDTVFKIPSLVKEVRRVVSTDMGVTDMIRLVLLFQDSVRLESIRKGTVPGAVSLINGGYYWKPNITALDKMVDEVLLGFKPKGEVISDADQEILSEELATVTERLEEGLKKTEVLELKEELYLSTEVLEEPGLVETVDYEEFVQENLEELPTTELLPEPEVVEEEDRRTVTAQEVKRVADFRDLESDIDINGLSIEVLNGIGQPGIAKELAAFIKVKGASVPRFDNAGSFDYSETKLVDWKGNIDAALRVATLFKIDPKNIIVYDRQDKPLDFTMVLGSDWLEIKDMFKGNDDG